MNYCIQCTEIASGKTGCFLKATEQPAERPRGHFLAASPVFPGLVPFFAWARKNSVTLDHEPTG